MVRRGAPAGQGAGGTAPRVTSDQWGDHVQMGTARGAEPRVRRERRVWSAGVMEHVDGTREEALEVLRQRAEAYRPVHPTSPKRRRLYRESDGFVLVLDGSWQSFHCRFTVIEQLYDSAEPEPEPPALPEPEQVQPPARLAGGPGGGVRGGGGRRGTGRRTGRPGRRRRTGRLPRRPAGALRSDQRPGRGAGAERVGGGGGRVQARGHRERDGAGAPHRRARTRAGRPPGGSCGCWNPAGDGGDLDPCAAVGGNARRL